MSHSEWYVIGHQAAGMTDTPNLGIQSITWSDDPENPELPWGDYYPSLLIRQITLTVTASAIVAARRVKVEVFQAGGALLGETTFWSRGTVGANQVRRFEFGLWALSTTLVTSPLGTQVQRETLPDGLVLHPGGVLRTSLQNFQVDDTYPSLTVQGTLLFDAP